MSQAYRLVKGERVQNPDPDLLAYILLTKLPGYTLTELDREPSTRIHKWLRIIALEAEEAKRHGN